MSKSKGFLKKSVAYIFALLMVSSIGLSSYAIEISNTESTVQQADNTNNVTNNLEDGTYYVDFSMYRNPSKTMEPLNNWDSYIYKYAMVTAKDGQYTVTFKFDSHTEFSLIGFLKPEYFSQLDDTNYTNEGYATKNALNDFDAETSGLSSEIITQISDEFNDHYYDIDYTKGNDGSWYLRYTTDDLSQDIYLSGIGKYFTSDTSYMYMTLIIDLNEEQIQPTVDLSSVNVQGESTYDRSALVNEYKGCLTSDAITLETKDGKIYATYVYDDTTYLSESTRYTATQLLDEYKNPIEVVDNKFTLEYSSYEDLIFGKRVYIECTKKSGATSISKSNSADLIPNITSENIVPKDETTDSTDTNSLEDGTYYVAFSAYKNLSKTGVPMNNWGSYISKYAMVTAKDGKYTITFKFDSDTSFGLIGFLKPEYFSQLNDTLNSVGYATKNMLGGFDVSTSGLSQTIIDKISDDWNDYYYDIDYTKGDDGSWYLRYTTDDLSQDIYLSGLGKTKLSGSSYSYISMLIDLDEEKIQSTIDLGNDTVQGEFTYNKSDFLSQYKDCLISDTVTLETKDGKIYATYTYDNTAYLASQSTYKAIQLLDEYKNPIEVVDNKFTLVYSSYEDLIFGKRIYNQLTATKDDSVTISSGADLIPNITTEDIVLKDETTGVKVKTNSTVISKDSTLNVQEVADDPTITGDDDSYEFIHNTLGSAYNIINLYSISIQQGDTTITTTSQPVEIYLPIKEGMDKDSLRLLFCNDSSYGWLDDYANIVTEDGIDYYVIKTSSTWDFNSVYALYDLKSTATDGTSLTSGTYTVPIALFNATKTEEMSMSNKCLGDTAILTVDKQGNKTILLDFKSVELLNTQGYLIQMWYENSNGEYKEVTYTGYYKNEDGTYFTDDINAGTTDYYPTSAYFVLPTDSSQFNVKFRVSAMDAILNGSGDSSREAIFTVYYGNATKTSNDILDTPEEEVINREQTDTTALEELISNVEGITNSDDKYTVSTYTTFANALANAKSVLSNSTSSQDSVDSAYNTLKDSYNSLETKPTTNDTLADGKYTIYAQMLKTDRASFSMSNNAITHTATLEVINGEYYLTLEFNGLSIYNQFGYLSSLAYYNAGYTYNEYGLPKGELTQAEVLSTYDVVDQYNTADTPYPHELKIKLVDKSSAEYVPLQVFVPIMEAIADGSGTQDVLMQLDWDTLKTYEEQTTTTESTTTTTEATTTTTEPTTTTTEATTTTTEPTTTTTEVTTTTPTTTDNTSIAEILRLKKYILGISTDSSNLDYNQDGSINIFDLLSIKNSLFKK